MFGSVLVVCVGNICRSPVGERMLRAALPDLRIDSAGIGAVVGAPADPVASAVAGHRGLSLEGHVARQFTAALAADYDLILTMEPGHRREIARLVPQVSGKTMLFDQWTGGRGIEDPFRKPEAVHARVQDEIAAAAAAWAARLTPASSPRARA